MEAKEYSVLDDFFGLPEDAYVDEDGCYVAGAGRCLAGGRAACAGDRAAIKAAESLRLEAKSSPGGSWGLSHRL